MSADKFNIFSFTGKMKILHLSWFAFFVSFVVWFNLAPMLQAIQETFGLTKPEITTSFPLDGLLSTIAVHIGASCSMMMRDRGRFSYGVLS